MGRGDQSRRFSGLELAAPELKSCGSESIQSEVINAEDYRSHRPTGCLNHPKDSEVVEPRWEAPTGSGTEEKVRDGAGDEGKPSERVWAREAEVPGLKKDQQVKRGQQVGDSNLFLAILVVLREFWVRERGQDSGEAAGRLRMRE